MTNQTDLISEVRAALQAATPGAWEKDTVDPYVIDNQGHIVCRFWHIENEYQNEYNNAQLIANAPTWLQQLSDRLDEAVKALEYVVERSELELNEKDTNTYYLSNGLTMVNKKAYSTLKRIKGENG